MWKHWKHLVFTALRLCRVRNPFYRMG